MGADAAGDGAGAWVKTVGAWDATWAPAAAKTNKKKPQMGKLYFMSNILIPKKREGN